MSVVVSPPHGPPGQNVVKKRKILPVITFLLGLVIGYGAHIVQMKLQAEPKSRSPSGEEPAR